MTTATAAPDAGARAARYAVSAIFFLTGAGSANWAVRIPAVQDRLDLGDGGLGMALLGLSVGAITAMAMAGPLVAKHGSRPVTAIAVLAFAAALMLPAFAPNAPMLMLSLLVLGLANGMLDVAMNSQAAAVQRRFERPIMSRVHALYSLGGLVGAATGGQAAAQSVGVGRHLVAVGIVVAIVAILVTPRLLPASADAVAERVRFTRPSRGLWALGVVAFCVLFGEGAMANWSAVYLRDIALAGPGLAAAGFAAFSLMMTAGRAAGDTLVVRFGTVRVTRIGGAVAALGAACAIAFPHPIAAIVGFGAIGAGLAGIFPLVLGASARSPGVVPGTAIAVISMCGYTGLLAGPPLIGGVANALTLRGGLGLVVLASVIVVLLARVVAPPSTQTQPRRAAAVTAAPADQRERAVAA